MTSWCSTRRWWSTASFFPVVFGNSLSQKIHGTWSSRFESSFTGCSGKAKTSKPCCVWISETEEKIISKYSSTRNYMLINLPLSAMLITRLSPGTSICEKRHFMSLYTTLFLNSPCNFPPVPATSAVCTMWLIPMSRIRANIRVGNRAHMLVWGQF